MVETLRGFRLLLNPRLASIKNFIRTRPKIPLVVIIVLSVLFLWGVHYLSLKMLSLMDEVQLIGMMLKNYLLSAVFLALFFMLALSNVINSLSSLFLSHDLELTLASPVKPLSIFLARFTEVMVKSSWMVILLLIPVMTAYQTNFETPLFFHVLWPIALFPYLVLTTSVGMVIATVMAASFPVRRAATALRAIFIVGIGIAIVVLRLLQPEQLVVPDKFYNFGRFLMSIHSPTANMLPSYYLSRIIVSLLTMDFFHLSWLIIRYLPLPVVSFLISWYVHKKLFRTGWIKMRINGSDSHEDNEKTKDGKPGVQTLTIGERCFYGMSALLAKVFRLSHGEFMVLRKEALVFLRTPALWIQTAMIGVIILIYIYNIRLLPAKSLASLREELPTLTAFCNIAFITFIVTAAALRFGFPSISMERNALALILASPFSKKKYITIKYWTSAAPLAVLALVLAGASSYLFETEIILTVAVTLDTAVLALTVSALAMVFGTLYGDLNSPDSAEIPSGWGGMIFMVISALMTALFMALQAFPFYVHFLMSSSIFVPDTSEKLITALCLLTSGVMPPAIIAISLRIARNRLSDLL